MCPRILTCEYHNYFLLLFLIKSLLFSVSSGLLTDDLINRIGFKFRQLLCEIKHRGAFEQADVGFGSLCFALWSSSVPKFQELPYAWLQQILQEIMLPAEKQVFKLTCTRRSAGLPFMVQVLSDGPLTKCFWLF